MKWILLIAFIYGPTLSMTSAEYDDKEACLAAAKNFEDGLTRGMTIKFSCAPKGTKQ